MARFLKRVLYWLAKLLGLFHLARVATKSRLRILGYHGFQMADEGAFRPKLFMSATQLEQRLAWLRKHRFNVIRLDDAIEALDSASLPPDSVVITIDDGFASVHEKALPVFQRFGVPATLYLTTHYFVKEIPVFDLVVSYMFWKTDKEVVDLSEIGVAPLREAKSLHLDDKTKDELAETITNFGETQCDDVGERSIAEKLGDRLGIPYDDLIRRRSFSLISRADAERLLAGGVDIQLHTHRHDLPMDARLALAEISENRETIYPIQNQPLRHFCYPNGDWSRRHWTPLRSAGIVTATTCTPGLVDADTPRLALPRFLDDSRWA